MATGPEHYQMAEAALRNAADAPADDPLLPYHLATAQIHAQLSHVAAVVETSWRTSLAPSRQEAWSDAGVLL